MQLYADVCIWAAKKGYDNAMLEAARDSYALAYAELHQGLPMPAPPADFSVITRVGR